VGGRERGREGGREEGVFLFSPYMIEPAFFLPGGKGGGREGGSEGGRKRRERGRIRRRSGRFYIYIDCAESKGGREGGREGERDKHGQDKQLN